jgi:hypothetical protein
MQCVIIFMAANCNRFIHSLQTSYDLKIAWRESDEKIARKVRFRQPA